MKKLFFIISMLCVTMLFFGCGGGKKEAQYLQVKAENMIDDYIRDQGSAEAKYKGKNIELTGNVISKGQFNNGNSFYVVVASKYAAGRSYNVVVEYPTNRVDDVNKLKGSDFVVAKGVLVGIVPQKNPTEISVQLQVGAVADGNGSSNVRPATPAPTASAPAPVTTVADSRLSIKTYYGNLLAIESRMKQFADRINSGESKPPLIAAGNVLRDDIIDMQRKIGDEPNQDLKNLINRLHDLQIRRVNCMLRGLRGDTAAYSEGGGYYDEFYAKFNKFKADNNL